MQVLPEKVEKILPALEIRVLVFASLLFYFILTLLGSRRRYIAGTWIKILVWSAYLAADATGTIALGYLVNVNTCCDGPYPSLQLQVFWVPFLLFYLGGPDTITAYSLEDNELWLRHFLSLLVQTGLAIYASLWAWNNSLLSVLAIPVFVNGIIKYVERTYMLRSSSNQCFKASAEHDPRLVLKDEEADKTSQIIHDNSAEDAFEMVAIELGIMHDMLYTKAAFVYSRWGLIFRFFSLISSVIVLVIFSIFSSDLHESVYDIILTYSLLAGAIFAEVYTVIYHLQSDWTKLIWSNFNTPTPKFCSSLSLFTNHKRWSETLGQFNLLTYCIKDLSTTSNGWIHKLLYLLNFSFVSQKDMNGELQELIFTEIKRKIQHHFEAVSLGETERGDHHREAELLEFRKNALAERGDHVLKIRYGLGDRFDWCTIKVEFEYSILAWHIATDLCYYSDLDEQGDNNNNLDPDCNLSICLSDYMLYLLIECPPVMPKGIGDLRFRETCDATESFLRQDWFNVAVEKSEALKSFFRREAPTDNTDDSLSVLRGGRYLFSKLQALESENGWTKQKKWTMITEMWVELLTFAANQSGWTEHVQQLKNGGELLTVVRLLMANLSLSEQYRSYGRSIP
ncbi:uncharacterized protein LOC116132717 [Pistacia vera]|uniref:uncharacterized protein LOC116132717 n=1 Tax=Pistacia vera TaxID=55513 RepID=UPI001262C922|nr:uncharacterized protein LOC116132717 [Pistacia vera]